MAWLASTEEGWGLMGQNYGVFILKKAVWAAKDRVGETRIGGIGMVQWM